MHYIVYGAGGIGGTIGGRLFQAGKQVTLIARGEHGALIQAQGLRLVDHQAVAQLQVPVVAHPGEIEFSADCVVLLCMKSQHCQAALQDLALTAPLDVPVVCVQNGVANERLALRYFPRVYACVVNLPAMYLTPGEVVTYASGAGGILDTGRYPAGVDDLVEAATADLSAAGFSARPDGQVMRFKYAKLLMNLFNILQAGLTDFEHSADLRRLLRDEALACYAAAGIDCAGAEEVKARQQGVYQMASVPGYERTAGSTWQSIARGAGDVETEYLNGEIALLGRLHGVPTPANDAALWLGRALLQSAAGPGIVSCQALMQRITGH